MRLDADIPFSAKNLNPVPFIFFLKHRNAGGYICNE